MGERLAGRRALVTGGGRGIGAAIAATLSGQGARLAVLDVDAESAEAVAADIGGVAVVADLADPEQAAVGVRHAAERLGGLDVVVNNAGVFASTPLLEITVAEWDAMFALNVRAMLVVIQQAAPLLARSEAGRVINLASMGGKVGEAGQAHYAASKAAVIALTRVAAIELGAQGTTVNCICPGYVPTAMGAAGRTEAHLRAWARRSPLGRLGTPDDVAAMAAFLASDDASYCTGQALNVAGGMLFH